MLPHLLENSWFTIQIYESDTKYTKMGIKIMNMPAMIII